MSPLRKVQFLSKSRRKWFLARNSLDVIEELKTTDNKEFGNRGPFRRSSYLLLDNDFFNL